VSETDLPASHTDPPPSSEPTDGQPGPVQEPLEPAAPDDRVEWQPVIDGDRIEWQPVMVSDATGGPPVAVPEPPAEVAEQPLEAAAVDAPVEVEVPVEAEPDPVSEAEHVPAGAAAPAWPIGETDVSAEATAAAWPEEPAPDAEPAEVDAVEDMTEVPAAEAGDWQDADGAESAEWQDQGPAFDYPDDPVPDVEWDPAMEADTVAPLAGPDGAEAARGRRPPPRSPARGGRRPAARPPAGRRPRPAAADDAPAPNVKKQVIVLTLLTLLVLGIGGTAFFLSRDATDTGEEVQDGTTPPASSSVASTLPESAMQTFSDPDTGFTVKYPRAWERLVPPVADIRLVVNAGGNDGFQVRVAPIQTVATTDNIGNFKAVTDAVVLGDQSARLLQEQLVTVNGHLTYYYLYSFQDPVTNTQGVHAHYFIFEGLRMFMLNFQTVPIEEFPKQAGVFDQIAESFAIPPRPATTEPAPTTTVP
jgi:hypothetical protein